MSPGRGGTFLLVLALWLSPAARAGAGAGVGTGITFTDVSSAAGLGGTYLSTTGHSLGINWIDFDVDGWPDLFVVAGGPGRPPRLFHNQRDGSFASADHLLPSLPGVEMSGSRFADVDRDGDPDLFVYTDNEQFSTTGENVPDGPANLFLRNRWTETGGVLGEGEPLFVEVAGEMGLTDELVPPAGDLPCYRSKTASWLDYDRDGCIDLYVGHLVMNSGGEATNKDRLYRNLCDGTFTDQTTESGLNPGTDPTSFRGALASFAGHLDGDLWPDLYVVNAAGGEPRPWIDDLIYRNHQGRLEEISEQLAGIGDDAQAGMGIDVGDPDLDGHWDVYVTDLLNTTRDEEPRGNVFYRGRGDGTFHDNSAPAAGIEGHNSWGVNFFDLDHDGDEDLFVATTSSVGHDLLYRNVGDGTFENVAAEAGIVTANARGSAVADFDHDGDLDLAVVNQGSGGLQLFRNDTNLTTGAGHWLQLHLRGTHSNRDAIGALVRLHIGDRQQMRQIKGGASAHSQSSPVVHFGLGSASSVDRVEILWPAGGTTRLIGLAADQLLTVEESTIFRAGFETGDATGWSETDGFPE